MRTICAYICGVAIFIAAVTPPAILIMDRNTDWFSVPDIDPLQSFHTSQATPAQADCCADILTEPVYLTAL
jgi:hypothetical protein